MTAEEIRDALAEPFDAGEVEFKPGRVTGNRCQALGYIDARCVMDRLDKVVGPANWQDEYATLPCGSVTCRLSVKLGDDPMGGWVTKMDVGAPSDQPDECDRMKAAFSDALKRAAVKFGIGRYLYSLPMQWVDFDPVKKKIIGNPVLPAFARPQEKKAPPSDLREKTRKILDAVSENGVASLELCWRKTLNQEQRASVQDLLAGWKEKAAAADARKGKEVTSAAS